MTHRLRNNQGFTIVELLIVIVVIGILAGLVLNTFNGIQARARDTERKTDINAIHAQVEAFHADNGYYPTTANIGDTAWVSANLTGLDAEAQVDPSSGAYVYAANDGAAGACTNSAASLCAAYVLSADLEDDGLGSAADADTVDYEKNSLN